MIPLLVWDGYFAWNDGIGQIDAISQTEYSYDWGVDTDWSISVGTDSVMYLATAWDDYAAGDEFALYVDYVALAWTSSYETSGFFHGEYEDLFLSAGTHSITLYTTALAPGFVSGAGHASFSGVTAAAPVPEPSTILLVGTGLLGIIGFGRKRLNKKA